MTNCNDACAYKILYMGAKVDSVRKTKQIALKFLLICSIRKLKGAIDHPVIQRNTGIAKTQLTHVTCYRKTYWENELKPSQYVIPMEKSLTWERIESSSPSADFCAK